MDGAATTAAPRTVAVYCGDGLPAEVPLLLPMTVVALGKAIVAELQATLAELKGRAVKLPDIVLWRVSSADAKALRRRCALDAAPSRLELDADDVIADDTFSADHRVWVQLVRGAGDGGGDGAWACGLGAGRWPRVRWVPPIALRETVLPVVTPPTHPHPTFLSLCSGWW